MEQDDFTLKQKQINNEEQVQRKKIPDDYHTLDRAGHVTLICLHTGHNRLNSHMHRRVNLVPSSPCTYGTEDKTTKHIRQLCPSYQQIWSDGTSLHQELYVKKE